MVCKAKIEEIISDYKVRVRVPTFHRGEESIGATPSLDTPVATICIPPSVYPCIRVGDTVWVDFEDDNVDKPVVMGILYSSGCFNSKSDIKCRSLEVNDSAILPENTTIGPITSQNISHLNGLNENVQQGLKDKDKRLSSIEKNGCNSLLEMLQQICTELSTIK